MTRYLLSAMTRLTDVPTSQRAGLLEDLDRLNRIRGGKPVTGLHPSLSKAVAKLDWAACEKEDRAAEAAGVVLLAWNDPGYPAALRDLPDPPPALYLRGSIAALGHPALAIVGSRLSTVYGQAVARDVAAEAVCRGFAVISGFARGIDTAAHRGSLVVPGRSIGVLGTGIDVPYPRENADLIRETAERGGAVLTELPPGSPPLARHFPMRNRVIAGLAWGVLIVEATERSGSLITARFALETGKEVFAVPHNITSRTGVGPNTLIQKGAKLVQRIEDVCEELPEHLRCTLKPIQPQPASSNTGGPPSYSGADPNAARVLSALKPDEAIGVDALCAATGLAARDILAALLDLQLTGTCVELPGMRYALSRPRKESI